MHLIRLNDFSQRTNNATMLEVLEHPHAIIVAWVRSDYKCSM